MKKIAKKNQTAKVEGIKELSLEEMLQASGGQELHPNICNQMLDYGFTASYEKYC